MYPPSIPQGLRLEYKSAIIYPISPCKDDATPCNNGKLSGKKQSQYFRRCDTPVKVALSLAKPCGDGATLPESQPA
jgi:hypothetical protein